MELSHNIKLHEDSLKMIDNIYARYTEVDWSTSKTITDPLIHMKPTEDTIGEQGEVNGYNDCLFFTLYVFNLNDMTVMKLNTKDGLDTIYQDEPIVTRMRMFKDGSAFLSLRGEYKFGNTQSVTIYPVINGETFFERNKRLEKELF